MLTTLPRLKDTKGITAEILPRLASDRRKKIPQVGKVFPKTFVQEEVNEKLDFHCVGLDKDKNVSFPTVEAECLPSSHGTEVGPRSPPLENGDGTEVTLPELRGILGSRRSSTAHSPDVSEPPDLLIKGEARKKSQTQVSFDVIEETPVIAPEEVMRSNLEPIIDSLFEEDELFAQDFDQDGLNRVLFIRKMGIYVEIKTKDYIPGVVCTPLFHCPRCKDHWIEFGNLPENCQFARQPTRGPPIHLASNRKPRFARKWKTKRRLGDIKEGFIVTGSGTVLNEIDENGPDDTLQNSISPPAKAHSTMRDLSSPDSLAFDEETLENLNLKEVDSATFVEAFKEVADPQSLNRETYVRTVAEALGFNEDQYNEFARVNTNEPLDKNSNKTLDKSSDKTPDKSGDQTPDKRGDQTPDKSWDQTPDKSSNKTLDKSGDKLPDKSGDKTLDKSSDKTPDKSGDQTPDKRGDQTPDKSWDQTPDKSSNKTLDKSGDKLPDKSGDKTLDKSSDKIPDKSGDQTPDKRGDQTPDKSWDQTPDKSSNKTLDKSGDKLPDKSGDKTLDKSSDKIPDKSGDQTPDKRGDQTPDKSWDQTPDKSSNKTLDKSGDKLPDKSGDKTLDKSSDKIPDKSGDQTPDKRGDQTPDKSSNKTLDKSDDKTPDKSGDKTLDKSSDKIPDKSGDQTPDKRGDQTPDKSWDQTPDKSSNKTLDKSDDKTPDKSGNKSFDKSGDSCGDLKTPTSSKTSIRKAETTTGFYGKSSVRSILNLSVLDSMTVKELPERVKAKMLSLLRMKRIRRQKQAASDKKKASHTVNSDNETSENYDNLVDKEMHSDDRKDSKVKANRKRRDSRVKGGGARRQSTGDINSSDDVAGGKSGFTEGSFRGSSASGRRHSMVSSADSDEEGFSTSRSPSDVLAYKELQNQRRSRKMNQSVKNRTGQPDTPFQRLGRNSFSVPNNSSSFYSYDDGDSDEENWARGRAPRVSSSRAHMSDSRTSYMSDMARGPHVSDSRSSMLRKYSRAMGSARSRKDVSFSNLDSTISYGSLGNDDGIYDDYDDDTTDSKSNRTRRQIRKKEKGDNVRRPRNYHSKVIALGQGSPSMSHVTASFGEANTMSDSNARLSQARISLTEASSALLCDSTVMNKRSVRPVSSVAVKEPPRKRKEMPEPECDEIKVVESRSESFDEFPPLDAAVPEDSVTTSPAPAQEKQSEQEVKTERLFKRVEKTKPLITLEDLNFIHRLPVSSAFTYSFYELPSQHREHNETIRKAARRIGRRNKKESGHFRSRSAP